MKGFFKELIKKFNELFPENKGKIKIVRAPGRINLIGEHTDYNQGFVLPVAIDKEIYFLASKRDDNLVKIYSLNFNTEVQFSLKNIIFDSSDPWGNYPKGVFEQLKNKDYKLSGLNGLYWGNIPLGAGMSSSAAIEVATATMLQILNKLKISPLGIIQLCQKAENEFVGVKCGIMDQFISKLGKKNCALFLDCQNLQYELVPLNMQNIKLVVANTQVKRELASSEYNLRRKQCGEGVKILKKYLPKINSLRDVNIKDFEKYHSQLTEIINKRCRHVLTENERVLKAVNFLKEKDILKFGQLLNESHKSLKEDYEVSCFELDTLVEIAQNFKGVLGSRMTGAGFGGCTISLVREEVIKDFINLLKREYKKKTKITPEIHFCKVLDGAKEVKIFDKKSKLK